MSKVTIDFRLIERIQRLSMELFEIEDDDYVDGRTRRGKEKAIDNALSKITSNEEEKRLIYRVISSHNFNYNDRTFKPIYDDLRALGYEITDNKKVG